MDFKPKGFLCTNNLVLRSPKIEYYFNFTLNRDNKSATDDSDKNKEMLVFHISPDIYDIKKFDPDVPVHELHGYSLFIFRNKDNKGTLFIKEFTEKTLYDLREVLSEEYESDTKMFCNKEILDQTTQLKITVDFTKFSLKINVNDEECIISRLDDSIFPIQKGTISLLGSSTKANLASLSLNEVSVSKMAAPLTLDKDHFSADFQTLQNTIMSQDPDFYNNTSITNLLMMDVS